MTYAYIPLPDDWESRAQQAFEDAYDNAFHAISKLYAAAWDAGKLSGEMGETELLGEVEALVDRALKRKGVRCGGGS